MRQAPTSICGLRCEKRGRIAALRRLRSSTGRPRRRRRGRGRESKEAQAENCSRTRVSQQRTFLESSGPAPPLVGSRQHAHARMTATAGGCARAREEERREREKREGRERAAISTRHFPLSFVPPALSLLPPPCRLSFSAALCSRCRAPHARPPPRCCSRSAPPLPPAPAEGARASADVLRGRRHALSPQRSFSSLSLFSLCLCGQSFPAKTAARAAFSLFPFPTAPLSLHTHSLSVEERKKIFFVTRRHRHPPSSAPFAPVPRFRA